MYVNVSKIKQSLYDATGETVIVMPGEAISEDVLPVIKQLHSFKPFSGKELLSRDNILIKRSHALGDVILLFPVINYLKAKGKYVVLAAFDQYLLDSVDFMTTSALNFMDNFDSIINTFGILELDHREPSLFEKSRLDIYCDFLGIEDLGVPNWNVSVKDEDFPENVIGIQLGGSTKHKNINLGPVIKELSKDHKLFIIDKGKRAVTNSNILHESLTTDKLLSYIKKMAGIICFDSGPLWLSHVANTAAFVIVGPTSGTKVTKYHPNPNTTFYDTKIGTKCDKACGESMLRCKGNYTCMKSVNHDKLIGKIKNWLEDIL